MRTNPFLIALLILVPLVVHLKRVPTPSDILSVFPDYRDEGDLFSYWKSHVLIALSFFSMIYWRKLPPLLLWLSVVFLNCALLSTLFSEFPYISVWGTPNYNEGLLALCSYFAVMLGATQLNKRTLSKTLCVSIWLVGFFCLLQQVSENFLMLPWIHWAVASEPIQTIRNPAYGTLMNPNHLGLYCALLLPYFLARYRRYLWTVPILFGLALASASRAAMVSLLVSTIFILFQSRKLFYLVTIAGGFVVVFLSSVQFHHTFDDRIFIYSKSISMLWNTLLLGKGPATFLNYFPQGLPGTFEHIIVDRPHNFYVQIAHGCGMLGLFTILAIIALSFQRGDLQRRAAIIGFMVATLFTDSFVGVSPLFFAIVGNCWREDDLNADW